jgi:hypothetical protein
MKNKLTLTAVYAALILASSLVLAAPKAPQEGSQIPPFPGTLVNARYVYVTSYDGDQFNIGLLPEDRQAIATVQESLQKWGKWLLVYQADQADIVLMVTSRPTEDVLTVYDVHGWLRNQYLWRMMGRGGCSPAKLHS